MKMKLTLAMLEGGGGGHAMRKSFTFIVDSFLCFCHTFSTLPVLHVVLVHLHTF